MRFAGAFPLGFMKHMPYSENVPAAVESIGKDPTLRE